MRTKLIILILIIIFWYPCHSDMKTYQQETWLTKFRRIVKIEGFRIYNEPIERIEVNGSIRIDEQKKIKLKADKNGGMIMFKTKF